MGALLALSSCDSSNAPEEPATAEAEPADTGARDDAGASADTEGTPEPVAEAEPAEPPPPAWEPRPEDVIKPHQPLEFAENLDYFFDALAQVDDGEKRLVRVVHMGASMIGADDLPAVLRERFQTRFGDGGAGLVLMARYMPNYMHRWVVLEASGWDHCYLAYKCLPNGRYGIGGTAFWSGGGAQTTIRTRKKELGDEVSKFELWYEARPGGGKFEVKVDAEEPIEIDTRAEVVEDRYHEIDVDQGPHKIRVKARGHGKAKAYGVLLETDGPGIIWDQFSKLGVFTKKVLYWDADHLAGQIAHRDPDLIAFTYGGNDVRRVMLGKLDQDKYVQEYSEAIQRVRKGKPEASCLVIGMTDRGKSLEFQIEPQHVETIVAGQREAAKINGCAFFDTYTAMGGGGSLKRWMRMKPPLAAGDLKHLNHRGRVKFGGWLYDSIVAAYVAHRTGEPVVAETAEDSAEPVEPSEHEPTE